MCTCSDAHPGADHGTNDSALGVICMSHENNTRSMTTIFGALVVSNDVASFDCFMLWSLFNFE